MESSRAIVITGPVGAGKTTTAIALAALLEQRDISCAMIDMDQLRWFYPRPTGDRFGSQVGLRHLAVMAASYQELGIQILVLADVIETGTEWHASAVPGYEITVVRLAVPVEQLHQRLRLRETEADYEWHENRAVELTDIMERNRIGDLVIQVNHEGPEEIALMIAERLRLL